MNGYKWVKCWTGSEFPASAFEGGMDVDGSTIYVGRALHCGDILAAKVIPEKNVAYVSYGGQEIVKTDYEVLCTVPPFRWEDASDGSVPKGALATGTSSCGETLYVGRVHHEGSMTIGKVHPSHGCLFIPFGCTELSFRKYQVLVCN